MEYNIQKFNHEVFGEVRVVDKKGSPWFILSDICNSLELTNPSVSAKSLDDEVTKLNLGGLSGEAIIISESGLYTIVLRCRDAVKKGTVPYEFRRWVISEVLPTIRKTGKYEMNSGTQTTIAEPYPNSINMSVAKMTTSIKRKCPSR